MYKKVRKSLISANIDIFHQKFWQLLLYKERKIKICANTCFFSQAIDIANRHDLTFPKLLCMTCLYLPVDGFSARRDGSYFICFQSRT